MKIIHTADWHIGKLLHKQELYEEMNLFFDWLVSYISDQKVDLLLVAGDIFDLANPSNKDTRLYFHILKRLSRTGVKTIITGGNHDSVSLLHASAELLEELNITVVGGVPDHFEDQLIPIHNDNGSLACVVLAVPFLRDKDLRLSVSADEGIDRTQIIPQATKLHYDRLVHVANSTYGDKPVIAMGHLFMQGSMVSDSEREIHVGNLQGLDSRLLSNSIDYMALGHIHKPQRIDKKDHIRYSGSPVYLDFSEAGYEKVVIQIELKSSDVAIKPIKLPIFRRFVRLKGSLERLQGELSLFQNDGLLPAFVELDIIEDVFSATIVSDSQNMENQTNEHYKVIKSKLSFVNQIQENRVDPINETIDSLTPTQIFDIRLATEQADDQVKEELKIVYGQILESLQD